ncbi:hypothetical protein D9M73_140450 [compost metagenome]
MAVFCFAFRVIGTEGGDFDDFTTEMDVNQLETAADDARIAKFGTDLFGGGAGGDIEVLGGDTQELVAHAATDQVGLVASILQALNDTHRMTTELATLQRVLTAIDHFRRGALVVRATYGRTERLEQLLQHGMHCLKECSAKSKNDRMMGVDSSI